MTDKALPEALPQMPPVTHRHAQCKNCDAEFVYWRGASEDSRGKRPECPECDTQGIGGPFGRTSPAEYLGIVAVAADGTKYEYRDWLSEDVVAHVDYQDGDEWLQVVRRDYLPCAITTAATRRIKDGEESFSRRGAWSPGTYWNYVENDVGFTLVAVDELPAEAREHIR